MHGLRLSLVTTKIVAMSPLVMECRKQMQGELHCECVCVCVYERERERERQRQRMYKRVSKVNNITFSLQEGLC